MSAGRQRLINDSSSFGADGLIRSGCSVALPDGYAADGTVHETGVMVPYRPAWAEGRRGQVASATRGERNTAAGLARADHDVQNRSVGAQLSEPEDEQLSIGSRGGQYTGA